MKSIHSDHIQTPVVYWTRQSQPTYITLLLGKLEAYSVLGTVYSWLHWAYLPIQ